MPATLEAARAGVTTGEWARALRDVFGEYRAPTGVEGATAIRGDDEALAALREKVERVSESLGRRIKILVGKPGLDGHSNGAEQIAVARARRRHGRRLRGHPSDSGADRPHSAPGRRSHRRSVDPLRLASGADPGRARRARARPASTSRSSSAASFLPPTSVPCSTQGSRASTRRRTSRSRASWATSSTSSPSAPG